MALLTSRRSGVSATESPAPVGPPSTRTRRSPRWRAVLPPVLVLVGVFALWQLLVSARSINPAVLPGPRLIVASTWADRANLWPAVATTTVEAVLGLALAGVVAFAVALAVDASRTVRASLYPLVIASQTLPIIALAPLVVIWWGFGMVPKVVLVALFSFFPMAVGLIGGLAAADPDALNLLRTMRASRIQLLRRVKLPGALPQFFTGLKISVTYAYSAAIVAEFVGAQQGLGVYMTTAKNAAPIRTDLVFGAVFVTALLTVALFVVVGLIERLAMPWRARPGR
ncbi:MAG TPA: ABC transporter permease [Acidimicrobiales bacterium]|nr:ABC transporter permease [Acidimicrobiales bacterium]